MTVFIPDFGCQRLEARSIHIIDAYKPAVSGKKFRSCLPHTAGGSSNEYGLAFVTHRGVSWFISLCFRSYSKGLAMSISLVKKSYSWPGKKRAPRIAWRAW